MKEEKESKDSLLEKLVPILLVASILLAFLVGILWQKVNGLEKGGEVAGVDDPVPTAAQPQRPTTGKLPDEQAKKFPSVSKEDHIRGKANPEVYLVEYSDYECPFCSRFHETAKQVLEEYGDSVSWVYRHFPLISIHPNAMKASIAAECVFDLGGDEAFWSFSDKLYEDSENIKDLAGTASSVGVDKSAFENCVSEEKFKEKVEDQIEGGSTAGVTGTPGNFIVNQDGDIWLVPGAVPFEQLKTTLDEALGS